MTVGSPRRRAPAPAPGGSEQVLPVHLDGPRGDGWGHVGRGLREDPPPSSAQLTPSLQGRPSQTPQLHFLQAGSPHSTLLCSVLWSETRRQDARLSLFTAGSTQTLPVTPPCLEAYVHCGGLCLVGTPTLERAVPLEQPVPRTAVSAGPGTLGGGWAVRGPGVLPEASWRWAPPTYLPLGAWLRPLPPTGSPGSLLLSTAAQPAAEAGTMWCRGAGRRPPTGTLGVCGRLLRRQRTSTHKHWWP